jgi:hypothetical protein
VPLQTGAAFFMPEFIPVKTRSDAIKAAQTYLEDKPSLSGGNLYELPNGDKLRVRKKEGGRLSAENYSTKETADTKRSKEERKFKTEAERENVSQLKKEAKQQSASTEHQFVAGAKPTILEHDVRLASGGSNEYVSLSDPEFKVFKDTVESKVYATYGDKYVVDIDDVTGYPRVIPKQYHNKYQPTSQQPGLDFEPGVDIDKALQKLPNSGVLSKSTASIRYTPNVTAPPAPKPKPTVKPASVAKPVTKPTPVAKPVAKPKPIAKPKAITSKSASIRFSSSLLPADAEVPSQERFGPGGFMSTVDQLHERQGLFQR